MYFFQQLLFFVVVIFVGHSSKKTTELDAAGTLIHMVLSYSIAPVVNVILMLIATLICMP